MDPPSSPVPTAISSMPSWSMSGAANAQHPTGIKQSRSFGLTVVMSPDMSATPRYWKFSFGPSQPPAGSGSRTYAVVSELEGRKRPVALVAPHTGPTPARFEATSLTDVSAPVVALGPVGDVGPVTAVGLGDIPLMGVTDHHKPVAAGEISLCVRTR